MRRNTYQSNKALTDWLTASSIGSFMYKERGRQVCYLVNPIIRDDEIRRPRIAFSFKSRPRNRTYFRGMTKCDKEQAKTSPWRRGMAEAKWNYEQTTRSWTSFYVMPERRLETWKEGWISSNKTNLRRHGSKVCMKRAKKVKVWKKRSWTWKEGREAEIKG